MHVLDLFEGIMAPPCPIDGKCDVIQYFQLGHLANTYLLLFLFFNTDK